MNQTESKLHVIGVAYDGSPEADAALEVAAQLATDAHAALQLIGVFQHQPVPAPAGLTGTYAPRVDDERLRDDLLRRLEDAADSLPPELRAAVVLANGDPAEQLVRRAAPLSLLVIGSHGYGPVRRMVLGSVSRRVVREAECPVLVVPRRAHKEAQVAA
jgi:nucleotide-binding universal stress UspA family protein